MRLPTTAPVLMVSPALRSSPGRHRKLIHAGTDQIVVMLVSVVLHVVVVVIVVVMLVSVVIVVNGLVFG